MTRTQNMKYLLLFHGNNGYGNASEFYVIHISPILFGFFLGSISSHRG